jgi:NAD(P)-dependent dehydrogenase (short-subunit alcohol dehydrogenase family)
MSLENKKVVIIGGTSGMGLATAKAAIATGASVTIASRSKEKLETAQKEIGGHVEAQPIDLMQENSIRDFFQTVGSIDHLVVSGSSTKSSSFRDLATEDAKTSMTSKFWGPYLAAKYAQINSNGSIVLFSGILSRKPSSGMAVLSAINAAVEGLGRALAVELAPIRVNVISPGLVATSAYEKMPEDQREAMFQNTANRLPVGRIGNPEEIAATVLHLMENGYITGAVIDIDGGALVM